MGEQRHIFPTKECQMIYVDSSLPHEGRATPTPEFHDSLPKSE